MTRIALAAVAALGLTLACWRREEVVLVPHCNPPAGAFARDFRPAAFPDPALVVQDSGRLLIHIARGDSGLSVIQTLARASILPSATPLLVRRVDSGTFLASAPPGSAEVVALGFGYEPHRDTLAVRRGFIDTVSYRLKPACVYLQ